MLNLILTIFAGWPAILATVVLAILGLARREYRFLVAGAVLAFPFSWALSGLPSLAIPACFNAFLPLILFAAGFAMFRGREMIAWIVSVPFFLAVLMLFYVISAQ